ncbi:hypothetical protein OV090_24805 [Nannocystis sp. RBIL2]|uniref:hypothetical protein n=1 Tax=Nannocystis sp. RBIL2 TaxID=2996788 RepID=UPI002270A8BB|nr:hypothetical protein [Nannocystis sp. RBIL2]MCY1067986.1 hypothetical protein [Nannocystis sp. RBIL2]
MSDTASSPRRFGTLALRWCGLAYVCLALLLALGVLAQPVLLLFSVMAAFVFAALLLASASLAVAALALGLAAVYRGIFARASAREALFGLLAVALCLGGAVGVWYGSPLVWPIAGLAILLWAVLTDMRDEPAPAPARGEQAPPASEPRSGLD